MIAAEIEQIVDIILTNIDGKISDAINKRLETPIQPSIYLLFEEIINYLNDNNTVTTFDNYYMIININEPKKKFSKLDIKNDISLVNELSLLIKILNKDQINKLVEYLSM